MGTGCSGDRPRGQSRSSATQPRYEQRAAVIKPRIITNCCHACCPADATMMQARASGGRSKSSAVCAPCLGSGGYAAEQRAVRSHSHTMARRNSGPLRTSRGCIAAGMLFPRGNGADGERRHHRPDFPRCADGAWHGMAWDWRPECASWRVPATAWMAHRCFAEVSRCLDHLTGERGAREWALAARIIRRVWRMLRREIEGGAHCGTKILPPGQPRSSGGEKMCGGAAPDQSKCATLHTAVRRDEPRKHMRTSPPGRRQAEGQGHGIDRTKHDAVLSSRESAMNRNWGIVISMQVVAGRVARREGACACACARDAPVRCVHAAETAVRSTGRSSSRWQSHLGMGASRQRAGHAFGEGVPHSTRPRPHDGDEDAARDVLATCNVCSSVEHNVKR